MSTPGSNASVLPPSSPPSVSPPVPPPPPSPPSLPPSPPLPPLAPAARITTVDDLRARLASAVKEVNLYLEPGLTFALSGVQLSINASDTYVILTSEGEGATIDAGGLSRAIEVSNGARLKMRGVHVTAGTTRPTHRPGDNIDGGCLLIRGALSHVSLSHMRMSGCSAPMGGAIAAMGGSAELTGVNITGSRATGPMLAGGGALLVSDGGFATLTDTAIVDAEANGQTAMGGAVLVQSGAKAVLHATHLEQCVASAQLNALGGAVAVRGGELVIAQGSSILRASCTQSHPHNSMRRAGGGVYVEGASAHIADTTIREVSVSGQR